MIDTERVATYIRETARAVILPRFRALGQDDVREKKPGDPVTVADTEAEQELTRRLRTVIAGANVLGEESVAEDPSRLAWLSAEAPVWIIDPIDGTANFAAGKPEFCSMLALVEGDRLLASWIHEPLPGRTTCAVAGSGIEVFGTPRPVSLEADKHTKEMRGVMAVGHKGRADLVQRAAHLKSQIEIEQVRSLRCAGFDYLRLLAGELDFLLFSGVMPWDHAAGALLVQERGGLAGYLGDEGRYVASRALTAEGVLAAARPDDWRRISAHLMVDGR
jgi:fructose-1,6-bisphosphatase/inositol monophosphatase family enzyme